MWFDSWAEILQVLIIGSVSYAALVAVLRVSDVRNRLSESEVLQAVRATGSRDLSDIAAVVLKTNGTISVIPESKAGNGSALKGVRNVSGPERP